jgi:hypothetical protein
MFRRIVNTINGSSNLLNLLRAKQKDPDLKLSFEAEAAAAPVGAEDDDDDDDFIPIPNLHWGGGNLFIMRNHMFVFICNDIVCEFHDFMLSNIYHYSQN